MSIVRSFWAGEKLAFRGEFFTAENMQADFKPEHPVPLYIASLSPRDAGLRRAHADGAILSPALATPETTSHGRERPGRRGPDGRRNVDKASYLLTSVDEDGEKARDVVRNFYFFLYQLSEVIKPESLEGYGVSRRGDRGIQGGVEERRHRRPRPRPARPRSTRSPSPGRQRGARADRRVQEAGVDLPDPHADWKR